jgi:hypothetical protein
MTAVILAQVVVTNGMLEAVGVTAPGMRSVLARLLAVFAAAVGTPYAAALPAAEALRRRDAYQSRAELAAMSRADLAASLA